MGLVYDEGTYVTLTDILGSEDAFGDMDFKVAGTADAVTALQLDTKIDGLPADVLAKALLQAKEARLTILGVMAGAIAEPRDHVADSAPKIVSMEIPIDKIGEVIGPKGKVINTLQQETGADIAVDDDGVVGTVTIGAKDGNAVEEARRRISLILDPPTAEVGAVYAGKVVNITKFGAFVNVLPGPRRPAAHLEAVLAGRRQAHQQRRGRADAGPGGRGPRRRHRPAGQGVAVAGRRCPRAAPAGGAGDGRPTVAPDRPRRPRAASALVERPHRPGPAARPPSRTPSRPSWWPTSATSGPGAADTDSGRGGSTATAATTAGPRVGARVVVDRDVRPAVRHPPGHRDHGGCPLGRGRLLGRHRLA